MPCGGPPAELGLGTNLWEGQTLSAWIERCFGLPLGVREGQNLFRQLRFRLRELPLLIARLTRTAAGA